MAHRCQGPGPAAGVFSVCYGLVFFPAMSSVCILILHDFCRGSVPRAGGPNRVVLSGDKCEGKVLLLTWFGECYSLVHYCCCEKHVMVVMVVVVAGTEVV